MKATIEIFTEGNVTVFHNIPLKVANAVITILSEAENTESEVFSSRIEVDNEQD